MCKKGHVKAAVGQRQRIPLELEIKTIMSSSLWVLGTQHRSSAKAGSAVNHRVIAPAPTETFLYRKPIIICKIACSTPSPKIIPELPTKTRHPAGSIPGTQSEMEKQDRPWRKELGCLLMTTLTVSSWRVWSTRAASPTGLLRAQHGDTHRATARTPQRMWALNIPFLFKHYPVISEPCNYSLNLILETSHIGMLGYLSSHLQQKKKKNLWNKRDGSVVMRTNCSRRGPTFSSRSSSWVSKTSGTRGHLHSCTRTHTDVHIHT